MTTVDSQENEISTEPLLLLVQSLYKAVENTDWQEMKLMDRFESTSHLLNSSDLTKTVAHLAEVVSNAAVGIYPQNLDDLLSLAEISSQLIKYLFEMMSTILQSVAILYHRILAVTQQLFEKVSSCLYPMSNSIFRDM